MGGSKGRVTRWGVCCSLYSAKLEESPPHPTSVEARRIPHGANRASAHLRSGHTAQAGRDAQAGPAVCSAKSVTGCRSAEADVRASSSPQTPSVLCFRGKVVRTQKICYRRLWGVTALCVWLQRNQFLRNRFLYSYDGLKLRVVSMAWSGAAKFRCHCNAAIALRLPLIRRSRPRLLSVNNPDTRRWSLLITPAPVCSVM